jgi:hypothetical protein
MWTPTGQVLVPLGRVGGGLPDRVEIGVRLAPAQLRHAGRVFSNVTVARELAPPEYDDATPAGDGPIDTLTHAAGADIGVTEVAGGWPAQRGESVSAWRRRADAAFRHGGRAVTRSDYADLVAARFPELCVLQVEPCRLGPAARRVDGVRVVIVPRRWASAYDLLNRAAAAAPRVARLLQPKAVAGVQVDVGPPAVAVNDPPPLSDPLSVYGEFLAVGPGTARRPDHPDWPTYRLDEIPQATQEGE